MAEVRVNVMGVEQAASAYAAERRRRLGKVYAFLLSLGENEAPDVDQAGEQDASEAGRIARPEPGNASRL